MIGLDTNVLVRYLTQDDPEQSLRANRLIESCCTRKGSADFADYVIVFCNRSSGCELTYSFDKKLGKHRLVRIP